ncbi:MAG: chorismate-binding protein, partial [Bacteriovoracaceae bacterium]
PGGSVTGAPKKRVLDILRQLESRDRGFYCGSTILLYKNAIAASINIRSAEIDLESNIMSYSSGGGITLLSKSSLEYKEMYKKLESFTQLFV